MIRGQINQNQEPHQCQQKLLGRQPQAGIVFAGVNFDHRLMLDCILDTYPGLDLVGCSTAGEFSSSFGYSDDSISLMLFYSDDIEIGIGVGRSLSENPAAARQAYCRHSKSRHPPGRIKPCFFLSRTSLSL